MNHPFSLQLEDLETLDFEILPKETAVTGAQAEVTTLAIGEEGGDFGIHPIPPIALPPCLPWKPFPKPINPPIKPPIYTTLALGEEGGDFGLLF